MQQHISYGYDSFKLLGGMAYYSPTMEFVNYCNTAPNYLVTIVSRSATKVGFLQFDALSLAGHTDWSLWWWPEQSSTLDEPLYSDKWLFPQVRTTGHPYFDLESDECFTINYGGNVSNTGTKNGLPASEMG